MQVLTKEMLQKYQRKTAEIEVPELSGVVVVREMSGVERSRMEEEVFKHIDKSTGGFKNVEGIHALRLLLVKMCVIDDRGNPLFSDKDDEFISSLGSALIEKITDKASELSGIDSLGRKKFPKDFFSKGNPNSSGSGSQDR